MFRDQRGAVNISLLTAVIFVAVIFITGVYIGQEIRGFYWMRDITDKAVLMTSAQRETAPAPTVSFMDCLRANYKILANNPPVCQSPDGGLFIGDLVDLGKKKDLIRLDKLQPYQKVVSPLLVEGEARGSWFFEANFPVMVTDWDGLIIGQGIAYAQGEWMTKDFVPFVAIVEFDRPSLYNNGTLILQKDNPSGLPEHDDTLEVPIIFQ